MVVGRFCDFGSLGSPGSFRIRSNVFDVLCTVHLCVQLCLNAEERCMVALTGSYTRNDWRCHWVIVTMSLYVQENEPYYGGELDLVDIDNALHALSGFDAVTIEDMPFIEESSFVPLSLKSAGIVRS